MKLKVVRNDITNMRTGAIVLPANSELREGSGTSRAIFNKAGRKELVNACKDIKKDYGKIPAGQSVPTLGFGLSADYIIHSVVPVWSGGEDQEYELLSASYLSALGVCDAMNCESIAFPLLGAGNNGFDPRLAFEIAEKTIESFEPEKNLQMVYLVAYDQKTTQMLQELHISIEEQIDGQYQQKSDESCIFEARRKVEEGTEAVKDLLNSGLKAAKEIDRQSLSKMGTEAVKAARMCLELITTKGSLGHKWYIAVSNEKAKAEHLKPGNIVGVSRGIYEHYAVYTGNDEVIHYAGVKGDFSGNISVHRASFDEFLGDSYEFFIMSFFGSLFLYSPEETIERAESRLDERCYDLVSNNCEHFAMWCKTGMSESRQVEMVLQVAAWIGIRV